MHCVPLPAPGPPKTNKTLGKLEVDEDIFRINEWFIIALLFESSDDTKFLATLVVRLKIIFEIFLKIKFKLDNCFFLN